MTLVGERTFAVGAGAGGAPLVRHFDPDGAEIYVRPSSYYVRATPGQTFATVVESARGRGEVAIGYHKADPGDSHGVVLNPDKTQPMPAIDRVIVLADG